MKKLNLYFIAFAIIIFASCEKGSDDDPVSSGEDVTVDFSLAGYDYDGRPTQYVFITNNDGEYLMEQDYVGDTSFSSTFKLEGNTYNLHLGNYSYSENWEGEFKQVFNLSSTYGLSLEQVSLEHNFSDIKDPVNDINIELENLEDGYESIFGVGLIMKEDNKKWNYTGELPFTFNVFNVEKELCYDIDVTGDVTVDVRDLTARPLMVKKVQFSNINQPTHSSMVLCVEKSSGFSGCYTGGGVSKENAEAYLPIAILPGFVNYYLEIRVNNNKGFLYNKIERRSYEEIVSAIPNEIEKVVEDIIIVNSSPKSFEVEIPENISFWRTRWHLEKDNANIEWSVNMPKSISKLVAPELPEDIKTKLNLSDSDELKLSKVEFVYRETYINQNITFTNNNDSVRDRVVKELSFSKYFN